MDSLEKRTQILLGKQFKPIKDFEHVDSYREGADQRTISDLELDVQQLARLRAREAKNWKALQAARHKNRLLAVGFDPALASIRLLTIVGERDEELKGIRDSENQLFLARYGFHYKEDFGEYSPLDRIALEPDKHKKCVDEWSKTPEHRNHAEQEKEIRAIYQKKFDQALADARNKTDPTEREIDALEKSTLQRYQKVIKIEREVRAILDQKKGSPTIPAAIGAGTVKADATSSGQLTLRCSMSKREIQAGESADVDVTISGGKPRYRVTVQRATGELLHEIALEVPGTHTIPISFHQAGAQSVSIIAEDDAFPRGQARADLSCRVIESEKSPAKVRVPLVMGQEFRQAAATLAGTGLVNVVVVPASADPPAGQANTVQEQKPGAGIEIDPSDPVILVVYGSAKPAAKVRVPLVVGQEYRQAVATLAAAGLANVTEVAASEDPAPGKGDTVQQQKPGAGIEIETADPVILVVYGTELPAGNVRVPTLEGMTEQAAVALLKAKGLVPHPNYVGFSRPPPEEALVTANDPDSGTPVPTGSPVCIVIGDSDAALAPVAIPDVTGLTAAEAYKKIAACGLLADSIYILDEPPPGRLGTVKSQTPASGPGRSVPRRNVISLWIYGKAVPGVIGQRYSNAVHALRQLGLTLHSLDSGAPPPTAELEYCVYRQDPAPAASFPDDNGIGLWIYGAYTGAQATMVTATRRVPVPLLIGQGVKQAVATLAGVGLHNVTIVPASTDPPPGGANTVQEQKPGAGIEIETSAPVILVAYGVEKLAGVAPSPALESFRGKGMAGLRALAEMMREKVKKLVGDTAEAGLLAEGLREWVLPVAQGAEFKAPFTVDQGSLQGIGDGIIKASRGLGKMKSIAESVTQRADYIVKKLATDLEPPKSTAGVEEARRELAGLKEVARRLSDGALEFVRGCEDAKKQMPGFREASDKERDTNAEIEELRRLVRGMESLAGEIVTLRAQFDVQKQGIVDGLSQLAGATQAPAEKAQCHAAIGEANSVLDAAELSSFTLAIEEAKKTAGNAEAVTQGASKAVENHFKAVREVRDKEPFNGTLGDDDKAALKPFYDQAKEANRAFVLAIERIEEAFRARSLLLTEWRKRGRALLDAVEIKVQDARSKGDTTELKKAEDAKKAMQERHEADGAEQAVAQRAAEEARDAIAGIAMETATGP